ncbi:hypothetical protein LXL04_036880 [Taraxacum kok-saghyz]
MYPIYSCEIQSDIFLACYILHNFLIDEDRDIRLEREVLQELLHEQSEEVQRNVTDQRGGNTMAEQLRNTISTQMWDNYLSIMSKQTAAKKEHTTWTEKMDSAFIEAMIEQQKAGNRINGTFTSQAYSNMVLEMSTKLNMNFTKDQLKNRMKSLKSNFSKWHDMFNGTALSVFSWNSETQLIEAEEEVWADLISAKPKARASGEYAETAKEKHARLTKSAEIKIENVSDADDLLANDVVTLGNEEEDDDEDIQILRQTFVTPRQSSGAKKLTSRKRKVEVVDEPVPAPAPAPEPESFEKSIMNTFSDIANVMREGNKAFEKHDYTMEDIENKLEPMGLEPEEFAKAYLYLSRNQSDARILFSSSMKMRMVFLKMMLSGDK